MDVPSLNKKAKSVSEITLKDLVENVSELTAMEIKKLEPIPETFKTCSN